MATLNVHSESVSAASPQGLGDKINRMVDAYADSRLDPRSGTLPSFAELAVALKSAAIGLDAETPAANDVYGDALQALMHCPAPDLAAVEIKLMLAFGDDFEGGPLAADLVRPIMADVARLKAGALN